MDNPVWHYSCSYVVRVVPRVSKEGRGPMLNGWLVYQDGAGEAPLDRVLRTNRLSLVDLVFRQEHEDVQPAPAQGTPLHVAALLGLTEAVQVLLVDGADPATLDSIGELPLHKAVRQGHARVATLVADGVDVNLPNGYGMTPLHYTALNGRHDIAGWLVCHGADPSAANETLDGLTPKGLARMMGYDALGGLFNQEAVLRIRPVSRSR